MGIANGTRAVISTIDSTTRTVEITTVANGRVGLPATYLEAGGLEHGYAMTAHRLQGATVDRAFVLGSDEIHRERGYTALSRHRGTATFYTVGDRAQAPLPGLEEHEVTAANLAATLQRRAAKTLATELAPPRPSTSVGPSALQHRVDCRPLQTVESSAGRASRVVGER